MHPHDDPLDPLLDELDDDVLAAINPALTPAVRDVLTVRGSIESRDALGGTSPTQVRRQLDVIGAALPALRDRWPGNTNR